MNKNLYSNTEFTDLKERINQEMLRRGTYKWWDPFTTPAVGEDKTAPLTLPDIGQRFQIDENTYTINNPSEGSIEPTRNIQHPLQGENPAGQNPDKRSSVPNTSAAKFDADEMRNFLVGLAKIKDINLFYGRDEIKYLAFRDPQGIEDVLIDAEKSQLNAPLKDSDISPIKNDPNGGWKDQKNPNYPVEKNSVMYPTEEGKYVMPSGEYDGEELLTHEGVSIRNFYDDYGAKPGDTDFHPINRYTSPISRRDWDDQGNNRDQRPTRVVEGGKSSIRFGSNPRNPQQGNQYRSRPVFGGKIGACNIACSGLCYMTCDNQCSESCSTTCWNRCGEACFKEGTLIETINGPVPIEEIKVGDMVLTQSGEYHRVYNTFKRSPQIDELIKIKIHGAPELYTTKNHPFWIKKYRDRKMINRVRFVNFDEPTWIEAKDIDPRDKASLLIKPYGNIHIDEGVAYMVGRWLGDGWVEYIDRKDCPSTQKRYFLCCDFNESYELESLLDKYRIDYYKEKSKPYSTCQKYRILQEHNNIPTQKLIDIVSTCGRYAHGKFIPEEIYNWDIESIRSLLKGYFDADGSYDKKRDVVSFSSVSKKLIYGISLLLRMIDINPSISMSRRPNTIQGRKVNVHDNYTLAFYNGEIERHYSIFDKNNNCVWSTARTSIEVDEKYDVYNISVEGDPTYYADGVLVHNCTSTCGNVCTGCSTMCYSSCKTKCENNTGYSCLKAGAKAVKITTTGGTNGEPAQNHISYETYKCEGCSFSCQFYPNKKTECWDSGCMGKCFTSCNSSCSTSCYGGCIDNSSDEKNNRNSYKTGKGRGCSSGCTINCIGLCSGVCEGYCVQTCFHTCKGTCSDNCSWKCSTTCGSGCDKGCTKGCTGCSLTCEGACTGASTSRDCVGCGSIGGCTSSCQFDCNKNCMGWGCRSICGIEAAGACESNCRLNCTATSCTAMCSDACSQQCSTCVNTCGFQCGACTSNCSIGCGVACNITCTQSCSNSCSDNCVHSCSSECGGCSNLCYSCVGMCIGVCSVKCEDGCSSCVNTCGWWCDSSCSRTCFSDCSNRCINTCSGSCATYLSSDAKTTVGPDRDPTAKGFIYPHPSNRWEERESFKLFRDPEPYRYIEPVKEDKLVTVAIAKTKKYIILEMKRDTISDYIQEIKSITDDKIITNREEILLSDIDNIWRYHNGEYHKVRSKELFGERVFKYEYAYIWDTNSLGEFSNDKENSYLDRDSNLIVLAPDGLNYIFKQTTLHGGVYTIDEYTGQISINIDMIPGIINTMQPNLNNGGAIFIVILLYNENIPITNNDILINIPFEFEALEPIRDKDNNIIIIIKRDEFLFPEEEEALKNGKD